VTLYYLQTRGTLRFNALHRQFPGCTPRLLVKQLRELEEDAFIARTVCPVVPPKVEYALTDEGRSPRHAVRRRLRVGTLYAVGGGSTRMIVTLIAFVAGSAIATAHMPFWTALPSLKRVSLVKTLGLAPAVFVLRRAARVRLQHWRVFQRHRVGPRAWLPAAPRRVLRQGARHAAPATVRPRGETGRACRVLA
jgi:DNA-binding HxlR family transcriptional regulator